MKFRRSKGARMRRKLKQLRRKSKLNWDLPFFGLKK